VVFGSFNHLGKLSPATWALWGRVLAAVPHSRLVLKGSPPDPDWPARPAREAGIDPSRVELLPFMASRAEHFASYAAMDIALDPVPYHGTTTTCEALWMGRPVVTLAGDRHVRRVGASLLTAIGEADNVCGTENDYVETAVRLASDRAGLAARSARLRAALSQSALGDAAGQGKAFAEALRSCWLQRT
jgi:protein O-GlcNAc transferase